MVKEPFIKSEGHFLGTNRGIVRVVGPVLGGSSQLATMVSFRPLLGLGLCSTGMLEKSRKVQ